MATASTVDCSLMFLSGLRGYHEYRAVWTSQLNEVLPTIHERTNPHDCYAIAARKRLTGCIGESTVGHLPKEISRVTRFIMLYGAVVTVKVLDTHHRRSPLVQGGLEIPIQIIVKMKCNSQNKNALSRYAVLQRTSRRKIWRCNCNYTEWHWLAHRWRSGWNQ